jgi:hypothetical protein
LLAWRIGREEQMSIFFFKAEKQIKLLREMLAGKELERRIKRRVFVKKQG